MRELSFSSDDHLFGLYIAGAHLENLLWLCERSGGHETGGVLVGRYTDAHNCAVVTAISGPSSDSYRGKTTFYRGTRGLQLWLDRLWRSKHHYYLGEWHYHPHASAIPSLIDIRQMEAISNSLQYNCPEPVLLIIGGHVSAWEARAFVCPRTNGAIEMQRRVDGVAIDAFGIDEHRDELPNLRHQHERGNLARRAASECRQDQGG